MISIATLVMVTIIFLRVFPWKWARQVVWPSPQRVNAFILRNITIGNNRQLSGEDCPADMFGPDSYSPEISMDVAMPGMKIEVEARNICIKPQRLSIMLLGRDENNRQIMMGLDSVQPLKHGEIKKLTCQPQKPFKPFKLVIGNVYCKAPFLDRLLNRKSEFTSYAYPDYDGADEAHEDEASEQTPV